MGQGQVFQTTRQKADLLKACVDQAAYFMGHVHERTAPQLIRFAEVVNHALSHFCQRKDSICKLRRFCRQRLALMLFHHEDQVITIE